MNCKIEIIPRLLHFKQPAGTSRGTYTTRKVWYLHFTSPDFPGRVGIGECAPLPALSCDDLPDYEDILVKVCRKVEREQGRLDMDGLCDYPSILFGLETAFRLKEELGGTITTLSMGPMQSKEVLLESFYMGADSGCLLSDRKFGGADVVATSYTLAQGAKKLGKEHR